MKRRWSWATHAPGMYVLRRRDHVDECTFAAGCSCRPIASAELGTLSLIPGSVEHPSLFLDQLVVLLNTRHT
jgi:hypothetical protein